MDISFALLFYQRRFAFFFLIFSHFSFTTLFSQVPSKKWDARFGGNSYDLCWAIQQTIDKGYIICGQSKSEISGDKTYASQGSYDYWVVKTDSNGLKEWDALYGGNEGDKLHSVRQTIDGGYIFGGDSPSDSSGDKSHYNHGVNDYWIVKTNSVGQKEWDVCFGGSNLNELDELRQTTDGGFILGGSSNSNISGDKTQESQGEKDFWIVKIDVNGVKQWDATFGGNGDDLLESLEQTNDGGFIMGGWSSSDSSGNKSQHNQGGWDYWIVKTDVNGIKQWDATFGGNSYDQLNALKQSADGGYILGGTSASGLSGDKTQESQGEEDYWIVKTDAIGMKQWDVRFGGSSEDRLFALQQDDDGGYILGGYSLSGISGDKSQASHGGYDFWIVKIDSLGTKAWDTRFGGGADDHLFSLEPTDDESYVLAGTSWSWISGDKSQSCEGVEDYWILKLCKPPIVNYSFSVEGLSVNFYDSSPNATGWLWDFGDGNTSTEQNPFHSYINGDDYSACLIATNNSCSSDTFCQTISVADTSCNAEFILVADSAQTGLYYGYNLSTGNNLVYTWDWGDGTTSIGQLPSHIYSDSGFYQICLIIYDTITACQDTFCANYQILKLSDLLNIHEIIFVDFSVGIPSIEKVTWSLLPNPTSDIFIVNSQNSQITELRILDVYGRNLKSIKKYSGNQIFIKEFPSQNYIVQVQINGNWYSKLLIKQ